MRNALLDVRHALRALRRNPWPVLASVLSLSLGIGATATMLAVVDAVDLRPLPFRDAERLVELTQMASGGRALVSPALFRDWQEGTRSYESLAAASLIAVSLEDEGRSRRAARASADFFATLGVRPAAGRTFGAEEVRSGARVAVISHDLWESRFARDPGVIGRDVSLSWAGEYRSVAAEPFTIVGVLPRGVRYPVGSDVWLPASDGYGESRSDQTLAVVARLRPDVTLAAARAELDIIGQRIAAAQPDEERGLSATLGTLRDAIRITADERGAASRVPLLLVAGFVLVLATTNVANLFAARATAQEHDLVIRAALGAPRARMATLLLAQTLAVSLLATALGVLIALWGVQLAAARLSVAASGAAPVIDGRVLLFALVLALVTGLAAGLLPVLRLARPDLQTTLRTRGASGRTQGVLVVAQVACALVLLSGAGLIGREFIALMRRDPGFDVENLLVARLPLSAGLDPQTSNLEARQLEQRIAGSAGIVGAALGALPAEAYAHRLEDGSAVTGAARPVGYRVSPDYFRTLGIPLLEGRAFDATDRAGSLPVGIISRTAAQRLWPGEEAVGRRVFMGDTTDNGEWVTIVGLADDERVMRNMRAPIMPVLYRPYAQLTGERRLTEVYVRTAGAPARMAPAVRSLIQETTAGEGWQGESVTTMREVLGNTLDQQRFRTLALTVFSAFGLLLAAMGIYGLVATVVGQRSSEIGIRIALGARPHDVFTMVTRSGIGFAAAGITLGLAGSLALTRVLQSMLVGSAGFDPLPPLVAGACLTGVVLFACWLPARRALRVNPTTVMRQTR